MKAPKITAATLDAALHSETVRRALRARAGRTLPLIRATAAAAGAPELARTLETTEGTRPGAKATGGVRRPYVRIQAEVTPRMRALDRAAKLPRLKIMRRGAGG